MKWQYVVATVTRRMSVKDHREKSERKRAVDDDGEVVKIVYFLSQFAEVQLVMKVILIQKNLTMDCRTKNEPKGSFLIRILERNNH